MGSDALPPAEQTDRRKGGLLLHTGRVNYEALYENWIYDAPAKTWDYLPHVVNVGMALKSMALFSRISGEDPDAFAEKMWQTLMRDHSMVSGHFSGDECLAGTSPLRGSELCSVAEAMYSYEWLAAMTGFDKWGDRLEQTAFNVLPAAISPDMWTHQYDQMTNQIQCTRFPDGEKPFGTNGSDAHLFGLEPNYGCCTANFGQAWPKFALSALMRTEEGLAITAIAPVRFEGKIKGTAVSCEVETSYPFEDGYRIRIRAAESVTFPLELRIPGFAKGARVDGVRVESGEPFVVEREWFGEETVNVELTFVPEYVKRPSGLYCLKRGPLTYALPIRSQWSRIEYEKDGVERKFPYCDYELLPQSKWNYGFTGGELTFIRREVGDFPFSPEGAPVCIETRLAPVDWLMENGKCAELPRSEKAAAPAETLRLIPYGCTDLRMTELPMIK